MKKKKAPIRAAAATGARKRGGNGHGIARHHFPSVGVKPSGRPPAGKKLSSAAEGKIDEKAGLTRRLLLAANSKLPYCFVLLCCMAFALQFGMLEPNFLFQKSPAEIITGANCTQAAPGWGFASGERLLLYLPHSQSSSVTASFDGTGGADGMLVGFSEPGLALSGLWINGEKVCGPCSPKEYPLPGRVRGRLDVKAAAVENDSAGAGQPSSMALFYKEEQTHAFAPLSITLEGDWNAVPGSEMPSTFYGGDAPFHVNRVGVLSDYLEQLRWPWADYTFVSLLPASLLQISTGISHEYAHKIYSIALFFVPVLVFFLFSRKLKGGGRAAFMFASLLYLAMPIRGYLTGGMGDLFVYGMLPYTLATYLSLFFLYFAYEFVWEEKNMGSRKDFAIAVFLFLLAVLSNQRICFALAAMFAVIAAAALASGKLRRALLLACACAFSAIWFVVPQLVQQGFSSYSRLGGISQGSFADALVGFFQLGSLLLPLFFAAGVLAAYRRRELFPLLLAFCASAVFLMANDRGLNGFLPQLDGMRLMPSFVLPAFFLAGIGAEWIFRRGVGAAPRLGQKLKMDGETLAGCVALALLLPLSFLYLSGVVTTWGQFRDNAMPLQIAPEYSSLQAADALSGGGRIAFVWRSEVSQYPVADGMIGRATLSYFNTSRQLAAEMEANGERVAVLGNLLAVSDLSRGAKWLEYDELRTDQEFSEVPSGGSMPLFILLGANESPAVAGQGVALAASEVDEDSARASGACEEENCSLKIYTESIPAYASCAASFGNCTARWNGNSSSFVVSGIPEGNFWISLAPQRSAVHYYSAAISLVGLLGCLYLLRKL